MQFSPIRHSACYNIYIMSEHSSALSPDYNLDVVGARKFESELLAATSDGDEFVVDLSGVRFVASSGLRVLLKSAQRLSKSGVTLVVSGASPEVSDVFRMSGFDSIMTIRNNA